MTVVDVETFPLIAVSRAEPLAADEAAEAVPLMLAVIVLVDGFKVTLAPYTASVALPEVGLADDVARILNSELLVDAVAFTLVSVLLSVGIVKITLVPPAVNLYLLP